MGSFKKNVTISGKYKSLSVVDGQFVDSETGAIIDLVEELGYIYGDACFELSTSMKTNFDLGGDDNE